MPGIIIKTTYKSNSYFIFGQQRGECSYDPVKHSGDLGSLVFNADGVAKINFTVGDISVTRDKPDGIIGRAVIVHATVDDFKTDPTGNAGGRVACGVIQG